MATNFSKAVINRLLDTWSFGDSFHNLVTNIGPAMKKGDSVDIPRVGRATVATSESSAVETLSDTAETLTVNRTKFVNVGVTNYEQLLKLEGAYANALVDSVAADLKTVIDEDVLDYVIANAAVGDHINLAGDALTDDDVNECEAALLDQRGVTNFGEIFWIGSPIAHSNMKGITENIPPMQQANGTLGTGNIRTINGYRAYSSQLIPGRSRRFTTATSAVSVTSNVATATVPSGHGFVAGQQIYTSGLTTNVASTSPATISSVTATTIVYPLTTGDGALADGVGTIHSATSMMLLVYKPWVYFAQVGALPAVELVKRETNAGYTMQMVTHIGRLAESGAVKILHMPD